MTRTLLALTLALTAGCGPARTGQIIQNKGSDTLYPVAQAWSEAYSKVVPDVSVAVNSGGAGTGVSALINGTCDLANCSRELTEKEYALAKSSGRPALKHLVGRGAIAAYVHKTNPMTSMTIAQLADIFGENPKYKHWSELGVTIPGVAAGKDEIVVVGRQNSSGTHDFFKEVVLGKGREFALGIRELHGSKDVVELVELTPGAIGYSDLAFATDKVHALAIAADAASKPVEATMDTAISGEYPISRPLFMYTAGEPKPFVQAYLDWIKSDAGQRLLVEKGYTPIRKL